ncbi:MAG: DUF975 family protein [Clostridiales bacterium]|nr:DUF975 family protein [Clostridiales bacterium]
MLTARDYRQRAYSALNGKWGTVAITYFLIAVVSSVCSGLGVIGVGAILLFVLQGPICYGRSVQALNVVRRKNVEVNDVMAAQHRVTDTVVAYLINAAYTFLWSLLFIIPGIIAAYSYSMTFYIMADNPKLTPDQARRESIRLMEGNKLNLFCLHLSFIGWILLCVLTLGILSFWVGPYIECATAEFYASLIPPRPTVEHVSDEYVVNDTIDPFSDDDVNEYDTTKPDEPFYVFEEELPRDTDDNPDSNISGKR